MRPPPRGRTHKDLARIEPSGHHALPINYLAEIIKRPARERAISPMTRVVGEAA
jgi:hypothetical protein